MNDRIKNEAAVILNENSSFEMIKNSINYFYKIFAKVTNLTGRLERPEQGSLTFYGEILSPQSSAGSIFDYVQTTKFLRGIKKAIDYELKIKSEKNCKILTVCPGPYAKLIIPLLPLFDESQLEITIIDIHERSISSIKSLISHFGFENYFDQILFQDPLTFETKGESKYDIIIIDSIQKALIVEPQVAFTNYFSRFLSAEGTLIPENIKISAVLADLQSENSFGDNKWTEFWSKIKRNSSKNKRIMLSEILNLDKNISKKFDMHNLINEQIQIVKIKSPNKVGRIQNLILLTEIVVFDDIILSEEDETGLTKPHFDRDTPPIEEGMEISFSYLFGSNPRFLMNVEKP